MHVTGLHRREPIYWARALGFSFVLAEYRL